MRRRTPPQHGGARRVRRDGIEYHCMKDFVANGQITLVAATPPRRKVSQLRFLMTPPTLIPEDTALPSR